MSADQLASKAGRAIAWNLQDVPDDRKAEFLELLAAGAIIRMRELAGAEHVDGFLIAAKADNKGEQHMNDQAIEQQVQDKGLNAPRITKDHIDAMMSRVAYVVDQPTGKTSTFVHAYLDGNFLLATGHSACVSLENFNFEIGYNIAKSKAEAAARDELWKLEGYRLYQSLRTEEQAKLPVTDERRAHIDAIARVCHEVNRAYCASLGDLSQPAWEDAPEWQRVSARMGVDLHLSGDFGPEASHASWMQQKLDEGWKYGPVKDPEKKEHHCIVPFDQLPREQQAKDYIFRAVVHALK